MKKKYFDYLSGAFSLNPRRDVISFVGAGGKSSAMIRMARELSNLKKKVIVTTTAKISPPGFSLVRIHRELDLETAAEIEERLSDEPLICAQRRVKGNKIKGLHPRLISKINRDINFNYMLVEADSAGGKSIKAPHAREPRVPLCTTLFIVVIGIDVLGKKINSTNVCRPRMLCRVLNKPLGSVICPEDLVNAVKNPGGLLKGRPPATRTAVIINKVEEEHLDTATEIAEKILRSAPGVTSVLCGQMHFPDQLFLFA